jgi:hypothetical protein
MSGSEPARCQIITDPEHCKTLEALSLLGTKPHQVEVSDIFFT